MRTTVTLEDDVAAKLQALSRRSGRPFKEVINETLRRGLASAGAARRTAPFKVQARDLGARRPGLNFDSVADLLEQLEGPFHR
jgi:Ribbon-helix-helix protein, copG family